MNNYYSKILKSKDFIRQHIAVLFISALNASLFIENFEIVNATLLNLSLFRCGCDMCLYSAKLVLNPKSEKDVVVVT